jgi:hypothetical protein
MPNRWIEHVRLYAKNHNIGYGCALSTPECRETYKPKVHNVMKDKMKAHHDLLSIAQKAKKSMKHNMKAHHDLLSIAQKAKPEPEVIIKPRKRVNPEIPLYFVTSNLKKGAYNKAVKQAEKGSEQAMSYLAKFPDKSRHHYKQVIYGVINDFDEIKRIEEELLEPDMSPSMITSRQNRLKETHKAVKDKLDELEARGFKPMML